MSGRGKETKYWRFTLDEIDPPSWNLKDIKYFVCNRVSKQGVVIFRSRKRLSAVSKAIPGAHHEAVAHSTLKQTIDKCDGNVIKFGRYKEKNPIEEFKSSIDTLLVSGVLSLGEFLRLSPFYQRFPQRAEELVIERTTFTSADFDRADHVRIQASEFRNTSCENTQEPL